MNCLQIFVFILLSIKSLIALQDIKVNTKTLQWTDCGGENATVRWDNVQVVLPIKLRNLTVGAKYTIMEEIAPGSKSKIDVWRIMKVLFVPVHIKIPCIGKFGSCEYDICRVMPDVDNFCIFQNKHNGTCGCPKSPQTVEGYDFKVRVPDTRLSSFQSLFVDGLYRLRWTWMNPKGIPIGCVEGVGPLTVGGRKRNI